MTAHVTIRPGQHQLSVRNAIKQMIEATPDKMTQYLLVSRSRRKRTRYGLVFHI